MNLGKVGDKAYSVFIKAALKGLIYYNTASHDYAASPPATCDDLISQGHANIGEAEALWCVGIESDDVARGCRGHETRRSWRRAAES